MATTTVYADGNGNITVNGVTMTAQQYMAQGGAGGGGGSQAAAQSNSDMSAKAIIENVLAPLGLQSLADWAWQAWNNSGGSIDYVESQLPQQKAFQDRFPEYNQLAAQGRAMSPAQIVAMEQNVAQLFHQYGIAGMDGYDPKTATAKMLEGDVSLSEMDQRLQLRQAAAAQYHPDVAAQLESQGVPNGLGALTAYVTDPKNALPVIQQKITAAQIGARGVNSGFGQINPGQATALAQAGVSDAQAQTGFAQLAQLNQLRQHLAGQAGTPISADEALAAQFTGNAPAQQAIQRAQQRQLGYFSSGGGFASTSQGTVGAGSAAR